METFSLEKEDTCFPTQKQLTMQVSPEATAEILSKNDEKLGVRSDDVPQPRELDKIANPDTDVQVALPEGASAEKNADLPALAEDFSGVTTSPMQSPNLYQTQFRPYEPRSFLEEFRNTHDSNTGEQHLLYRQWMVSKANKTYLVRHYLQVTDAFYENFCELFKNSTLKNLFSEVLWPEDVSERDENGDFWCLLPAPIPEAVPLSEYIFPKQKKISAKYTTDLCISFVSFLCKCQKTGEQKILKYFDPSEIFLDVVKGQVYLTGFDQIIDYKTNQEAAQEIMTRNQQQVRTFLPERFMPPTFLEQKILPQSDDLNYYAALFSCLLLLRAHPYEGMRWAKNAYLSLKDAMDLYGTGRSFLFAPENMDNGPIPNLHDVSVFLWNMQPKCMQSLFQNSFSNTASGTNIPDTLMWLRHLVFLRSVTYFCPCGNVVMNSAKRENFSCNLCQTVVTLPLQIIFQNSSAFRLSSQMFLYYGQFDSSCGDFHYAIPVCRIRVHKKTGEFGVESLPSNEKNGWTVWIENECGECKRLNAGNGPFPLRRGYRLYVNQCKADIQ